MASALAGLGDVAAAEGQPRRALDYCQGALARYQRLGNQLGVAQSLEGVARAAMALGQPVGAARLLGAAARLRRVLGTPPPPVDAATNALRVECVRVALGGAAFDEAWTAGEALALTDAIREALATRA